MYLSMAISTDTDALCNFLPYLFEGKEPSRSLTYTEIFR